MTPPTWSTVFATVQERSTHFAAADAEENHQKGSSPKVPLSGLLGGGSSSSPIAQALHAGEIGFYLRPLRTWAKWLGGEATLSRNPASPATVMVGSTPAKHNDHHPGHGGLHHGEHHSNRTHSQRREKTDLPQAPKPEAFEFIPGPKLRAKLGISAVTLWRWRHDREKGFPAPKVINGRLYFALGAVVAWLARQADAA